MGYVETVLGKDERVFHRAHLHWIVYFPAVLAAAISLAIFGYAEIEGPIELSFLGVAFLPVALFVWLSAWIARVTTEIAVTNRRVIVKRGLIRRWTMEMNLWQIESVGVDQSIPGRLLDFGTVIVRGTGAGIEPISKIAEPLRMREAVSVLSTRARGTLARSPSSP
jgi:uncharacterized membrane protein YdbT with pleckstrin-like domain